MSLKAAFKNWLSYSISDYANRREREEKGSSTKEKGSSAQEQRNPRPCWRLQSEDKVGAEYFYFYADNKKEPEETIEMLFKKSKVNTEAKYIWLRNFFVI